MPMSDVRARGTRVSTYVLLAKGYLVVYVKASNDVLFLSYHFIAVNKKLIRAAGNRRSSELSNLDRTCPPAKLLEVLLMNVLLMVHSTLLC